MADPEKAEKIIYHSTCDLPPGKIDPEEKKRRQERGIDILKRQSNEAALGKLFPDAVSISTD